MFNEFNVHSVSKSFHCLECALEYEKSYTRYFHTLRLLYILLNLGNLISTYFKNFL